MFGAGWAIPSAPTAPAAVVVLLKVVWDRAITRLFALARTAQHHDSAPAPTESLAARCCRLSGTRARNPQALFDPAPDPSRYCGVQYCDTRSAMIAAESHTASTLFLFVDESGNSDFSAKGTRYFLLAGVVALDSLTSAQRPCCASRPTARIGSRRCWTKRSTRIGTTSRSRSSRGTGSASGRTCRRRACRASML